MPQTLSGPSAVTEPKRRGQAGGLTFLYRRDSVGLAVLWIVLGSLVGEVAVHARDYLDVDAARYEHLAISIARTGSLIPRVNGVDIHSYSQLYPLLIAPFFRHGLVVDDMKNVNLVSAYIMSSACIPAFLLTRRVTRERWAWYLVAALTICMPWIVLALAMMTEVAAYPAAVWVLLAFVVALAAPSWKHDLLAMFAVAIAFFARSELIGLVIVFPLALAAFELGRAAGRGTGARAAAAARSILRGHPVLVALYGAIAAVALALYLEGRLASVLGVYSAYQRSAHLDYGGLPRSIPEHLATFSLAFGVVPFVIALAWIGANVVRPGSSPTRHAFACVAACVAVVLFVQATNFDLVVNSYVHDRFLLYYVPVVLVGTVLAVTDDHPPRWSLVPGLVLVVVGFGAGAIPRVSWGDFPWMDLDTPISTVYRVLVFNLGGSLTPVRIGLIVLAISGTAAFVVATRALGRSALISGTLGFMAAALVLTTWAVFDRTFSAADRNARPLSQSQRGRFDWVDQRVGPDANVTAIMYPISSDWFVNQQRWADFLYFNKSIQRIGRIAGQDPFDYAGLWFPKLDLHFDRATGAVAESPTRWILESDDETRFRVVGPAIAADSNGVLVDAGRHWRLAWLTSGLYDDGWTRPGKTMVVRLYSQAGQREPELRTMSYSLRGPANIPERGLTLSAQGKTVHAEVNPNNALTEDVQVCVPPHGYADIRLSADGSSWVYPGDLATHDSSIVSRRAGILVASLGEADEIGGRC